MQKKRIFILVAFFILAFLGMLSFMLIKDLSKNGIQGVGSVVDFLSGKRIKPTQESLEKAIKSGKKIECVFVTEKKQAEKTNDLNSDIHKRNKTEETIYFEGNKYKYIRKHNLFEEETENIMFFDGETFYRWSNTKESVGMKASLDCINGFEKSITKEIPISLKDILEIEKNSTTSICKEIAEPIHLAIPTNRTLIDVCKVQKEGFPELNLRWKIEKGNKLECKVESNGAEKKVYIEGKKFKAITSFKGDTLVDIFDGEVYYSWNPKTKEAAKISMDCIAEAGKGLHVGSYKFNYMNEMIYAISKKENCREIASDIDFKIPTDMNFVDQCTLMKNMTEKLK